MSPWVVVALLAGFVGAFLWQRTRVAGAHLQTALARAEARTYAAACSQAWGYANQLEHELQKGQADSWDEGLQNGVGIRVDLGEVEP